MTIKKICSGLVLMMLSSALSAAAEDKVTIESLKAQIIVLKQQIADNRALIRYLSSMIDIDVRDGYNIPMNGRYSKAATEAAIDTDMSLKVPLSPYKPEPEACIKVCSNAGTLSITTERLVKLDMESKK